MSTNNREFDFFALMASLEAHMLKDPNVRDASPSEALENYFSRKGKRSQRRKNAFRAQRHRRNVMAEKFDTASKSDGILRKMMTTIPIWDSFFMTILSISFVKKVDGLRKICGVSASLR